MNTDPIAIVCAIFIIYVCGFGWGMAFAERSIRKEQADLNKGRVVVSMPMHEDQASDRLGLLSNLMREVEKEEPTHDNQLRGF